MKTKRNEKILLIIFGLLTVIICAVMNLILIPQIEKCTNGMHIFDMSVWGYSFEEAQEFVLLLNSQCKAIYLTKQLPLDFFYPVCYGCFFMLSFKKLCNKRIVPFVFPALLMAFDYGENICSIIMIKTNFSAAIAAIARVCTASKTVLMYGIFAALIVMLICWIFNKKRAKI